MYKVLLGTILAIATSLALSAAASAHVVVQPDSVEPGAWQTFSMSVPNEKDTPTTRVILQIPNTLDSVTPTVQSGFTIQVAKDKDAVKSITWTGQIPVGQRAEFGFSAQAPSKEGELRWIAYQYYSDGSVVKWQQDPGSDKSDAPYSLTKVASTTRGTANNSSNVSNLALGLSVAAIVLSLGTLFIRRRK